MPGLRDILDAATQKGMTIGVVAARIEAEERLEALAPELAALVLDMGELLRGRLSHGFVPGPSGDIDAYALLARLSLLGAGDSNQNEKEQT